MTSSYGLKSPRNQHFGKGSISQRFSEGNEVSETPDFKGIFWSNGFSNSNSAFK